MDNLFIGAWETSTKRIIAYAHLLGVDVSSRPRTANYHLGLYEIRDIDIKMVKCDEYKLPINQFIADELVLNVICDWGPRIANAKPRISSALLPDEEGLIHFCYEMEGNASALTAAPIPNPEEVFWNGVASYGKKFGRLVNA